MRIGEVPGGDLARMLAGQGVGLDLGAARVRVFSDVSPLARAFGQVYSDYESVDAASFHDVTVAVRRVRGPRRWLRQQIEFVSDGELPFEPFPAVTHLPLLEWGMNYALTDRMVHRLLLHAGVVEKDGIGILLPAIPGSGKSTLTAALMCRGYRLLSDEFAVVSLDRDCVSPMVRPIALKNESISVIRSFSDLARLGPEFPKTRKGTVAHLKPTPESIDRRHDVVSPSIVLFPKYQKGAAASVSEVSSETAFSKLSVNSFNYEFLGSSSFDAVARIVGNATCRRIEFDDLGAAVSLVDELVRSRISGSERGGRPVAVLTG
ncbi:MAG: HprK-related kinase A [Betaproteobacteria bacterium]|nr:HprK-related kinase A [Betaproteobacteria bacterium]